MNFAVHVAVEAVRQLVGGQVETGVAFRDRIRIVFVAGCTGMFAVGFGVAGLAGDFAAVAAVDQGESMGP